MARQDGCPSRYRCLIPYTYFLIDIITKPDESDVSGGLIACVYSVLGTLARPTPRAESSQKRPKLGKFGEVLHPPPRMRVIMVKKHLDQHRTPRGASATSLDENTLVHVDTPVHRGAQLGVFEPS